MNFSLTYIGVIVAMLSKLMEMAGVVIGTEQLTSFVETCGVLIGGIIALWGRWRKGDLTFFGTRKKIS